eukprot:2879847-Lingulodinium_polyedra.AAC.1
MPHGKIGEHPPAKRNNNVSDVLTRLCQTKDAHIGIFHSVAILLLAIYVPLNDAQTPIEHELLAKRAAARRVALPNKTDGAWPSPPNKKNTQRQTTN